MRDERIDLISDEREGGGEFFVYLNPGFALSNPPQHCFGARNLKEIRQTMTRVRKCACAECLRLIELGTDGLPD